MTSLPIRAAIEQQGRLLSEDDLRAIGREAGAVLAAIVFAKSGRKRAA